LSQAHALESIGQWAFKRCIALSFVKWASNPKTIGHSAFYECTKLQAVDMSGVHALKVIGEHAFAYCDALSVVHLAPSLKTVGWGAFMECAKLQDVVLPSSYHWFVRKLPFDGTRLQSVDMQGRDLKKAIRIKNLYPRATPRLSMDRLVSMYAESPLTDVQLEDAAQSDGSLAQIWAEARAGDLQRLGEIRSAYVDSVFRLLHWYAGNGLVKNLVAVSRKKRNRDGRNDLDRKRMRC